MAIAPDEHVDLVFSHELARVAPSGGGIRSIVEHDELDLAAADFRMLCNGCAYALFVRHAERSDGSRKRADEADLQVGCHGLCGGHCDCGEAEDSN
jgi:hypothetical protein